MCLVTVLLTVSNLAFEVSVALLESIFIVVSVVLFIELEESAFEVSCAAESAEFAELLPLQAAIDNEMARASKGSLNAFFMVVVFPVLFNVLIINKIGGILFGVGVGGCLNRNFQN